MDRLAAVKVFVAIAEAGSLSGAARRLRMPLTSVSRQLKALEDELGVRLITRTTRRLTLTDSGSHYLETCRRVLDELDGAERRLAGEQAEPQGELALTAPIVFGRLHVLPMLTEFLKAFPQVSARMLLVDRVVDLVEEGLDVGIRIGHLADSSLRAIKLGAIRYVACASPAYLVRHRAPKTPKELADHDCISFSTSLRGERWRFGGKKQPQVTIRPRLIVNTAEAALDAAKAGLGVVRVLSYQAAAGLKGGSLRLVLDKYEPDPIPVTLVHREDRLPQMKVQSFIVFAGPRLRDALYPRSSKGKRR